jgi:hypothetical protein
MTIAVCIRCGRMKVGAFTPCSSCQFTPQEPEELAKSVLLSDRVTDREELNKASERLQAGGDVGFDEQAVAEWATAIATNQLRMPIGCIVACYAPIVILVFLVIALVVLIIYPRL